jgi:hypothetical protein
MISTDKLFIDPAVYITVLEDHISSGYSCYIFE